MCVSTRILGGSISRSRRGDKEEPCDPRSIVWSGNTSLMTWVPRYDRECDDTVNEVMDAKVSRQR